MPTASNLHAQIGCFLQQKRFLSTGTATGRLTPTLSDANASSEESEHCCLWVNERLDVHGSKMQQRVSRLGVPEMKGVFAEVRSGVAWVVVPIHCCLASSIGSAADFVQVRTQSRKIVGEQYMGDVMQ